MQLTVSSNRPLKRPHVIVRPLGPEELIPKSGSSIATSPKKKKLRLPRPPTETNPLYIKPIVTHIFKFLTAKDVASCALVCTLWAKCSVDPTVWYDLDVSNSRLTIPHLTGIVRRQPRRLRLDWTSVTKHQLSWLLSRLPQLRHLSLNGCTWSSVSAMRTCSCPPLLSLNLGYVSALNDANIREVLSPPTDSRPGLVDKSSRLRQLKSLSLAGCDITDVTLRYITQHLPNLEKLDLSSCGRVSDAGVAQLSTPPAPTVHNLASLDLSNCKLLTEASLDHLSRCKVLKRLDLRHTTQVSTQAIIKFAAKSAHNLHVTDVKLVQEKKTVL